ncbi:PocR ligand-binding domain-containing protein [Marinisporobacter balticus]|uniref:Ligand-binding sensor protein n=1 Tax=Marinisporobacter balticus TaxID=2018667 RepID=A0A4V2S9T2_9FIRM|nr:PocR ligand-binding domain-containing protein [Marinisporobacter balticus]TCO69080.1 ligand-binding sensor protein [Marinisporobacter balticus]
MKDEKILLNLDNVKLQDVINVKFLQKFQDDFATAIGLASVTVDKQGIPVTEPSQYTRFCNFVHSTEKGDNRCAASHKKGGEEAARLGKPVTYECHAGLIDFAAPIMIEGKLIGTILGGQVIENFQGEEKYRQVASEIDVNEEEFVEASKQIRKMDRKEIIAAAEVLYLVANNMAKGWYQHHKLKSSANTLNESLSQIAATMQELAASAQEVSSTQNKLNKEIENVNNMSEQIGDVLEFIKEIADETRMLGLNAAIEAARAGAAGLGFGVVAQEIRKLSSESKQTVIKIKSYIDNIQSSVKNTVKIGDNTVSVTEQQAAAIQQVTASIEEITELADNLNSLAQEE